MKKKGLFIIGIIGIIGLVLITISIGGAIHMLDVRTARTLRVVGTVLICGTTMVRLKSNKYY